MERIKVGETKTVSVKNPGKVWYLSWASNKPEIRSHCIKDEFIVSCVRKGNTPTLIWNCMGCNKEMSSLADCWWTIGDKRRCTVCRKKNKEKRLEELEKSRISVWDSYNKKINDSKFNLHQESEVMEMVGIEKLINDIDRDGGGRFYTLLIIDLIRDFGKGLPISCFKTKTEYKTWLEQFVKRWYLTSYPSLI